MKKLLAILLSVIVTLALTACGSGEAKITGTYEVDHIEAEGVSYTVSEMKALGDDSLNGMQLVIKDGGKAYVADNVSGELVDWELTENGIMIGERECTIVDSIICVEYGEGIVYFKKASDSQEIKITAVEDNGVVEEETTNTADEVIDGNTDTATDTSQTMEHLSAAMTDAEETIASLVPEYEELKTGLDTYSKYKESIGEVEAFYAKVLEATKDLCIRMREYSIDYTEAVLSLDKTNDEKYDDMDELYDCIYEDVGDEIYDEMYDGILDDMYDDFYDGVIDDAYDEVDYDEWSDIRSNEYERWSDCRSEVYDEWSDFRSDVYDLWSDIHGELWDDDIERAREILQDFQKDVEKRKETNTQSVPVTEAEETADSVETASVDDVRPEFKEAMDSYEAFYDEYCSFMEKYMDDPTDLSLVTEYTELVAKAAEADEAFAAWGNEDLNDAELAYYLEVSNTVTEKLLAVM